MTSTTPCQTCWADDPVSGANHGCLACQAVVSLADKESQIDRFIDACVTLSELTDEPSQDDLDALEDGIGTRANSVKETRADRGQLPEGETDCTCSWMKTRDGTDRLESILGCPVHPSRQPDLTNPLREKSRRLRQLGC